jgi:tRNA pseudouridine38-40 synthase
MTELQGRRFKLVIEYDGTDFVGWQLQRNGRSVQGELEAALYRLFHRQTRVHGAGRTDAGVHATGQVAHFDLACRLDARTLLRALHAELPPDITIREIGDVTGEFHSRFSASSRSYVYTIVPYRVSLNRRQQWILYADLDHDAIREAVAALRGTHDFTTFSKRVPDIVHHYCHVFDAVWEEGAQQSRFHITANRFLQGMVRALVGGLVHVGRQRMTPSEFAALLTVRDRVRAPMLAPPHGLVLTAVRYDEVEYEIIRAIMDQLRMAREREE